MLIFHLYVGRSVRASQVAFEHLAATYPVPGQDYRRPHLPAPMVYSGSDISKKRPHQPETSAPVGRLLQPRPPHSYPGEFMPAGPAYSSAVHPAGEPTHKKKRGRPTKAEAQQRAQEAAARGEVYPPPRRGRQSLTGPPEPSPLGQDPRPLDRTTPPTTTQSQAAPVRTPQQQVGTEQGSESSSGKRRRIRPQPLELEKHHTTAGLESPLAYGSADPNRSQAYASFTPKSAPLPSSTESRDRDVRMEGVEETQARTTTPHSFKDTVGI